jgi:hypothetical protein
MRSFDDSFPCGRPFCEEDCYVSPSANRNRISAADTHDSYRDFNVARPYGEQSGNTIIIQLAALCRPSAAVLNNSIRRSTALLSVVAA